MKIKISNFLSRFLLYGILIIASVVVIFPIYWMLRTSLIPVQLQFSIPVEYIPSKITFNNYLELSKTPFLRWFFNSAVVSTITAFLCVGISSLAGYSIARLELPRKNSLKIGILAINMLPKVALIIPFYLLASTLFLLDTYHGLILAYVAATLPFSTWMLIGYFNAIPRELEEAAMIDGCSRISALFRVVYPVAIPGIAAAFAYAFIFGWTEYILSVVIISKQSMMPLTVGLTNFIEEYSYFEEWPKIMGGGFLCTIPIVILFSFLQKFLVQGLTSGAVKG